ncbi:MAG TPA: acetate kinase [Candidatus Eisenbacteria bacterium]|nr:acetate kinase [Candidatus Eisenbacteria bacterium]
MKVLVLNAGSSTLKFQVIDTGQGASGGAPDRKLARGLVERIGGDSSSDFELTGAAREKESGRVDDHAAAVRRVLAWLESKPELRDFEAVGHRVVHGGDRFTSAVVIDDAVFDRLRELSDLAPLHNPASLAGIRAASALVKSVPAVAVFDTSFHHTIPEHAFTYAIPHELAAKHRIRRYGFHGLAHQYAALRYSELAAAPLDRTALITLHLGNGCSACAIREGKSVDTSMGFTPLEGLVMGTRSGDIDPAIVAYLSREASASAAEVEAWLNDRSGLLGISGESSDMRDLFGKLDRNPRSRLAIEVFCYRARKYVGAYLAALGGADAIVFSGGIGEHCPPIREKICSGMRWCGLELDREANAGVVGGEGCISGAGSRLACYVVRSDEESLIARETARLVSGEHRSLETGRVR